MATPRRVAVVGAGMAGAACARALADAGVGVRVIDKGRAVGGRMAQRRADDGRVYDHGAQYLTARDPALLALVDGWKTAGAVAPWAAVTGGDGSTPALIGVPGMSAPARLLLEGLDVATARRVSGVRRGDGWRLGIEGGDEEGPFDALVLAVPAPQAADLLAAEPAAAGLAAALGPVAIEPCWAGMLAFDAEVRPDWTGRRVEDGTLAWVARNNGKPGREGGEAWTVHATPAWSREHLEDGADEVARHLALAFARLVPEAQAPARIAAHRWRYAFASRPLGEPCLLDRGLGLGLCGDWCLGPRVEAAFLSGRALAAAILDG